jgi:hypothetical protein
MMPSAGSGGMASSGSAGVGRAVAFGAGLFGGAAVCRRVAGAGFSEAAAVLGGVALGSAVADGA